MSDSFNGLFALCTDKNTWQMLLYPPVRKWHAILNFHINDEFAEDLHFLSYANCLITCRSIKRQIDSCQLSEWLVGLNIFSP